MIKKGGRTKVGYDNYLQKNQARSRLVGKIRKGKMLIKGVKATTGRGLRNISKKGLEKREIVRKIGIFFSC